MIAEMLSLVAWVSLVVDGYEGVGFA